MIQEGRQADATSDNDQRQELWLQFLENSTAFCRTHPDQFGVWRLRAEGALALVQPKIGREAARHLLMAPSPSVEIRAALAELQARGWTTPLHIRTRLPPGQALPHKWVGRTLKVGDPSIKLIWIAPGKFRMGTSPANPEGRLVHISRGYWIGATEINQEQWEGFMGMNPSNFQMDHRLAEERGMTIIGEERPVEQVSWAMAMEFCHRLTAREHAAGRVPPGYEYRLPTEAEWEYAARAGTVGDYPGGLERYAWYDGNAHDITHDVGHKKANAWGLHDMAGNVAEWCFDWFATPDDEEVTDWAVLDPDPEELTGSTRVIRGGSWLTVAARCQPSYRVSDDPGNTLSYVGFRVALAPVTKAN